MEGDLALALAAVGLGVGPALERRFDDRRSQPAEHADRVKRELTEEEIAETCETVVEFLPGLGFKMARRRPKPRSRSRSASPRSR